MFDPNGGEPLTETITGEIYQVLKNSKEISL